MKASPGWAAPFAATGHNDSLTDMLRKDLPSSSTKERRSGLDRRGLELERAGRPERRRGVEARKPDVVELDMSTSEWLSLSAEPVVPKSAPKSAAKASLPTPRK